MIVSEKAKRVIKNSGWMMGERVFQLIITLIVGALTARYLGPDSYGVINYAASIVTIFSVFSTLGIDSVLIQKIIEDPESSGKSVGTVFYLRLISGFSCAIAVSLFVYFFESGNNILIFVTILQSFSLVFKAYEVIDYYFQSQLKSKFTVIVKSISALVIAVWKCILLVNHASIYLFAMSISIDAMVCFILLIIVYKINNNPKMKFELARGNELIQKSYHFIFTNLMIVMYTRMDKIMVGALISSVSVGIYSSAAAISEMWLFIPLAMVNSAQPVIMELKGKNEEMYQKRLRQLYAVVIYFGIFMSIGITIFSKLIIYILYGEAYLSGAPLLSVLVWSGIFAVLGSARGVWIVCENLNKYSKYYTLVGCLINLILNFVLIKFYGALGSAIATLFAQVIVACIAPLFFKKTRGCLRPMLDALLLKNVF